MTDKSLRNLKSWRSSLEDIESELDDETDEEAKGIRYIQENGETRIEVDRCLAGMRYDDDDVIPIKFVDRYGWTWTLEGVSQASQGVGLKATYKITDVGDGRRDDPT